MGSGVLEKGRVKLVEEEPVTLIRLPAGRRSIAARRPDPVPAQGKKRRGKLRVFLQISLSAALLLHASTLRLDLGLVLRFHFGVLGPELARLVIIY